ncbi:MAG: VanW family protein [Clostridia bacterium]
MAIENGKTIGKKVRRKHAPIIIYTRFVTIVLFVLFSITCLITLAVQRNFAPLYDENSIFSDGVTVDGIDVSGMKYDEARLILLDALNIKMNSISYTVSDGNFSTLILKSDLGISCNIDDVLIAALLYENNNSRFAKFLSQNDVNYSKSAFSTAFSITEASLSARIDEFSVYLNREPIEPFAEPNKFVSEPAFIYHDGQNGRILNSSAMVSALKSMFLSGTYTAKVAPIYDSATPKTTIEHVKSNTNFYAVFQTMYNMSESAKHPDRIHNIRKASLLLNGCTIKPGEEFSFNDFMGPRTSDGGWLSAPGIVNGSTYEMQPGGGICQVSTTLHNALMLCGDEVDITSRKNHSWPSSYVDYGLDATVSTDGPDLKFINNTGESLYIFSYADNTNYTMRIYVYGKGLPDGVTYNVRATTDKVIEPEKTITIEEPTWPLGYTQTIVKSRKGYNTTAYRDKLLNGEVIDTVELYHYYYRPVQGKIKVGTGSPSLSRPDS